MRYVYPVVSRRAGGVSVGINLNPNNACNWRCIYCQVPDLARGGPPPLDGELLSAELEQMLTDILQGDFMATRVPPEARQLMDLAISGNGEPTSAPEFLEAVTRIVAAMGRHGLDGRVPLRLISNGSLVEREGVQQGLALMAAHGGEVWFKADGASAERAALINDTRTTMDAVTRRLTLCAGLCPTWVQSCFFALDGLLPSEQDVADYVTWLGGFVGVIRGVHLYGIARQSFQPEAGRLSPLPAEWFADLAARLTQKGLTVKVSP
jgi:hypothetical protein